MTRRQRLNQLMIFDASESDLVKKLLQGDKEVGHVDTNDGLAATLVLVRSIYEGLFWIADELDALETRLDAGA
jgi:hypothetical protein